MLQQTQVTRVVPAYTRFLRRFPSLGALAGATLGEVLREWTGLGYNRRARDLHRIARLHPRTLPRAAEDLDALPGVGAYTASAVACFAHGDPVAFADTNIRRVLGRALLGRSASEREARELDARHMPRRDPARWHHALMDIGATICVARRPRCERCPLRTICVFPGGDDAPSRKRPAPFSSSDRRVRGAIVRALAEAPRGMTALTLRRRLADPRVGRLLRSLAREGLVEVTDRRVRLPAG
jgi:A/G-specific adenine glycosylase